MLGRLKGTYMISEWIYGKKSKLPFLLIAAAILLFTLLGTREIWTQEHRWADIVFGMFFRHDFLHPFLGEVNYYDKPLLSYWLIASIAFLTGELSTWALRLPSAFAGLLAIYSIYRMGLTLQNKRLGLLSGWLLLTTFYFIFWARTTSADMLNMAGTLFAVSWYVEKKSSPSFINTGIFFLILSVTSLSKGLVAPAVAIIAILPDLILQKSWKKYLTVSFFLSLIPAIFIYVLPFWLSTHVGNIPYHENGLYEVYRENILRYFHPFDHKGPIYTYFIFLPIYLLPWTFFFIPTLFFLKKRWCHLPWNAKWMSWATLLLFLFFTLSGSRRNYYVLPILPFAILMTAEWMISIEKKGFGSLILGFFILLFLYFDVAQPIYYSQNNLYRFANTVQKEATKIKPWNQWHVVMLDSESKIRFYLQLPPDSKNYPVIGNRNEQTQASLSRAWPILKQHSEAIIFISRYLYVDPLKILLPHYQLIQLIPNRIRKNNSDIPIAFIPKSNYHRNVSEKGE